MAKIILERTRLPFLPATRRRAATRSPLRYLGPLRIRHLDDTMTAQAARFVESWNADDIYDRFGTVGTDGQKRLTVELVQRARSAVIAIHRNEVVGLLDHVYAEGAIHMGIVVDSRFRKSSIGTNLVLALLQSRVPAYPVAAECRIDNRAAAALLHKCLFQCLSVERYEMIWRHA